MLRCSAAWQAALSWGRVDVNINGDDNVLKGCTSASTAGLIALLVPRHRNRFEGGVFRKAQVNGGATRNTFDLTNLFSMNDGGTSTRMIDCFEQNGSFYTNICRPSWLARKRLRGIVAEEIASRQRR
jgi:hypothetical protein